jgi:hypothetical protein
MVIFVASGGGEGGTQPADGAHERGDVGMQDKGMEPGTLFRENVRVEFKLKGSGGTGVVFNKCLEVKTLVTKMEETGHSFELISEDGKSSIAGAKDFPEP